MKHPTALLGLSLLTVLGLSNNEANAQKPFNLQPHNSRVPSHSHAHSQDRQNIFDVELLRYMAETANGNFMISPASVKAVLGMILEGAKGSCADQLRKNLRLPEDQQQAREILNNALRSLQQWSPGTTVGVANKIFISNRFSIQRDYENLLKTYYFSQIETVNYAQPQIVANNINNWVNKATNGKIPQLVDAGNFDADTVMVLANALFFNGTWKSAFDEKLTMPNCFYVDNACHRTNMMELQTFFNYGYIGEMNAQAIELPYMGDKYSMLILMPNDKDGLTDSFIKDISYYSLRKILSEMESTDVLLSMPKFVIDYSEDLVSTLQKLGIQEIFGKKADLTGIVQSEQSPQVDNIVHRTRLEVTEAGSIAAAASGAMVIPLIGTSQARMSVDHPFLFFIRDVSTGVILFEGRVNKPTQQPAPNSYTVPITRYEQPQYVQQQQPLQHFVQPQQQQTTRYNPVNYPAAPNPTNQDYSGQVRNVPPYNPPYFANAQPSQYSTDVTNNQYPYSQQYEEKNYRSG